VQAAKVLLLVGIISVASLADAAHRNFVWNAPTTNEDGTTLTDLAGYRVYTCPAAPCSKANGTILGTVTAPSPTPAAGVTASFPIPHGQRGVAFVTAFDTTGNESVESNTVPFDLVAPSAPGDIRIP